MVNEVSVAVVWIRHHVERGMSLDAAAKHFASSYRMMTARILEQIGLWPNAEPELAALQKAVPSHWSGR